MSKQKMGAVALLMASIVLAAAVITAFTGVSHKRKEDEWTIVTSFYPVYIAALNLADGVEGVALQTLAGPQTGCLHDYQLSPDNQMALESADVVVLSGAGAESFLDGALEGLDDVPVVDLSQGIDLLKSDHAHEHENGEIHALYNEHIWTSPTRYARQIQNLSDALIRLDPEHAAAYRVNTQRYLRQIEGIEQQVEETAASLTPTDTILFHESLAYLAQDLGVTVLADIPIGEDEPVSASTLVQAEQAIRPDHRLWLLYDSQYPSDDYDYLGKRAKQSQKLTLDMAVRGPLEKDAWLNAMTANLEQIRAAEGEGQ